MFEDSLAINLVIFLAGQLVAYMSVLVALATAAGPLADGETASARKAS